MIASQLEWCFVCGDAVQGGASVEPVVRIGRGGNVVVGSRGSRLAREAGSSPRGERGWG